MLGVVFTNVASAALARPGGEWPKPGGGKWAKAEGKQLPKPHAPGKLHEADEKTVIDYSSPPPPPLATASTTATITGKTWNPEVGESEPSDHVVCGMYGDPHIELLDGTAVSHSGTGEYQLLDLPDNNFAVHYYGCPVNLDYNAKNYGTYTGALAIQIGSAKIEILGNKLTANGIAYTTNYDDDGPQGPYELNATVAMVTVEREAITTADLTGGEGDNKASAKKEAKGIQLYRWSVYSNTGLLVHSHASKVSAALGKWSMDVHISFPNSTAHTGLCVEKCKYGGAAASKCPEEAACHQVTEAAKYGISPLFSNETLVAMGTICPARVDARESVTDCAPPPEPTPEKACEDTGLSLQTAKIKCAHLIDAEQFYNDCIYDFCMGADPDGTTEWVEEHNPPPDTSCKVVSDPRFKSFKEYKYSFAGEGIYNILYQEEGDASSCEVEIQSLECHTPCPGEQCGRSYMQAVGIKAQGRAVTHDIILHGANCTLDGTICGTTNGQNVGTDGVKIIPYTPIEGLNPYMGEYGPGLYGWYIYSGGYAINVTMTKPTEDTFAMNLISHTPPMCTAGASGLCMESNTTKDETIKVYAADYARRSALAVLKSTAKSSRIQKALSVLAPEEMFPRLPSYPAGAFSPVTSMSGLEDLTCQ